MLFGDFRCCKYLDSVLKGVTPLAISVNHLYRLPHTEAVDTKKIYDPQEQAEPAPVYGNRIFALPGGDG